MWLICSVCTYFTYTANLLAFCSYSMRFVSGSIVCFYEWEKRLGYSLAVTFVLSLVIHLINAGRGYYTWNIQSLVYQPEFFCHLSFLNFVLQYSFWEFKPHLANKLKVLTKKKTWVIPENIHTPQQMVNLKFEREGWRGGRGCGGWWLRKSGQEGVSEPKTS